VKLEAVWQDIDHNLLDSKRSAANVMRLLLTARFRSVVGFRLAQWLGSSKLGVLADVVKQINQSMTGADIAWQSAVEPGLILFHPVGVVIGPDCTIGRNAIIQQGVTIGGRGDGGGPTIGDDVFIGAGARILGSVVLGRDVVIGANAVVVRDVPAGKTAMGVPARWSSS
jgi:serine O-acetyltransferase